MRARRKKFELDKEEGKVLGVCAGLADYTGIDATIVRIAVVLATIAGGFPWTVIAYFVAAFVARPKQAEGFRQGRIGTGEHRERMRDLDLRMQAVEHYATSSNSSLAREIEELR